MHSKRHTKEEVKGKGFLGCMYFHDEDGLVYGKHFAVFRLHSQNGIKKYASDQFISLN